MLSGFLPYLLREATIGAIIGLVLGTVGGVISYFWQGAPNDIPQLGLAVGVLGSCQKLWAIR
jgi:magnesium transporter